MYKILSKTVLNPTVTKMDIYAPLVAKKAAAGQFIILRVSNNGERIPLTIADTNCQTGAVTIIFQLAGATTIMLNQKEAGQYICDFVGPLGKPTQLKHINKACIVGGGVGCAIAYPIAKELHRQGKTVHTIAGFRSKELVILENEFQKVSDLLITMTDDGSYGKKGLVTNALQQLIDDGNTYDEVITIGPLIMMKFVCDLTKKYSIKTTVSMNSIMIDGTGMCGCCRLTVDGKMKFACVDGPDFDGHAIDFNEAIQRSRIYINQENKCKENCNLLKKGTNNNG